MNKDFRNLGSHYNKYIYPKPIENIEEEVIKKKIVPYADPNFNWHILWPEKPYNLRSLRILIAGCGSDQASVLARCNPNHKFIGVDFSEQSIACPVPHGFSRPFGQLNPFGSSLIS